MFSVIADPYKFIQLYIELEIALFFKLEHFKLKMSLYCVDFAGLYIVCVYVCVCVCVCVCICVCVYIYVCVCVCVYIYIYIYIYIVNIMIILAN